MFKQITFFGSGDTGLPGHPADVPIAQRQELHDKFQAGLLEWNDGNPLDRNLNEFFIPFFMYTDSEQVERLKAIQSALNKAVVHLIDNWWTDEDKHYPKRMPIERHQEDLLRVSICVPNEWYVLNIMLASGFQTEKNRTCLPTANAEMSRDLTFSSKKPMDRME